jgi:AcrR family transcriptional regulator
MSPADSGIGKRRRAALEVGSEEYAARREELVRVAATVFKEKGYEAATLNDIAERFGADRASLYYYVASKEELFQDAVRGVLETNLQAAERILKGKGTAEAKLAALIEQVIGSYDENYPHTYLYIQEDMRRVASDETPWAQDMTRQTKRIESITIKLIAQGVEEGTFRDDIRPELAANALWGMLNWTHRWYRPGRQITSAEMAKGFSAIFFEGLVKRR